MNSKIILIVFSLCTLLLHAQKPVKNQKLVGADKDKHGCIGSAGYTYSLIKKECIRPFEEKVQLISKDSTKSSQSIGVVIFNNDSSKAEIIIAENKTNQILIRTGKKGAYIWKKMDLTLSYKKGFILKKSNKVIYSNT